MRILPRLISSAALALLVGWLLLWHPLSWPGPVEPCLLELTASSPGGALITVRLDEGHGYDDGMATDIMRHLPADGSRAVITLPLPPMRLRALKLEVTETAAVTIARARLLFGKTELANCVPDFYLNPSTVGALSPAGFTFQPVNADDGIVIEYRPAKSLILPAGDEPALLEELAYFGLLTALFMLIQDGLTRRFARPGGVRFLAAAARLAAAAAKRPALFLAGVGLCASLLSSYPVAFCGRSFVSPNSLPFLLYNLNRPTIAGVPWEPLHDSKNSDLMALMLYHLPCSALEYDALFRDHELPLWNRYNSCGVPLFGQGQSMFGDPLHFLPILANGASWAWDLKFLLAKALFSFGIGLAAWALTRRLGVAALIGASAAWIGFFAYRFDHPAFFSVCYAPWVLLPWLWIGPARSKRAVLLAAAGLIVADWCELTSGTAKEASMILLSLNIAGGLGLFFSPLRWRDRWRAVAAPVAASGLFLLLSAPHWLIFVDSLRLAATVYEVPTAYQLQPGLLAGFFDDIFTQDFTPQEVHTHPSANFLALAGVLWLAAAWISSRRRRSGQAAAALAWVAAGLAALVFGVVPPAWIQRAPFLGHIYHIHNTFGCPLIVISLLLAAVGLAHCLAHAASPRWSSTYVRWLFGLSLVTAAYLGFTHALPQEPRFFTSQLPWHSRFFVHYASALVAAAALLPWGLRWTQLAGARRLAGYILVGVCFAFLHFRHGMYVRTRFDSYVMTPRLRADLAVRSPALEEVRRRLVEPARTAGFVFTFAPGYSALMRLEHLAGPDALFNRYYRELVDAAGLSRSGSWWMTIHQRDLPRLKAVYDALNLRFYLREGVPGWKPPAGLISLGASDLEIFESQQAWPRAFFTDNLLHYRTPAELARTIARGDGRPFAAVQQPSAAVANLEPPAFRLAPYPARTIVPAGDYRLTTNTTEFALTAPGAGVVVLEENFEEGNFRVTLNGVPVPYFRVNHTFKGVAIEKPGSYRLRFEYRPRFLTLALWLSAVGAALTALSAWAFLRRKSPAEPGAAPALATSAPSVL